MDDAAKKLHRVAECLDRSGFDVYFAPLKVRGKQIKRSLKTTDTGLAPFDGHLGAARWWFSKSTGEV